MVNHPYEHDLPKNRPADLFLTPDQGEEYYNVTETGIVEERREAENPKDGHPKKEEDRPTGSALGGQKVARRNSSEG